MEIMDVIKKFQAAGRDCVREDDLKFAVYLQNQIDLNNANLDLLYRGKIKAQFNDRDPEGSVIELVETEVAK
jgi:hypothetical protein